jgi:DNA-binding NtrC family response regulator
MNTPPAIVPYRYLIIDDDIVTSKGIAKFLTRQGAQDVKIADNGKIAVKLLDAADTRRDIIICDLNMPELDGVEYILYLAEKQFAGGLILISGTSPKLLDPAVRLAGAHRLNILGTLTKPIVLDKLLHLIGRFGEEKKVAAP